MNKNITAFFFLVVCFACVSVYAQTPNITPAKEAPSKEIDISFSIPNVNRRAVDLKKPDYPKAARDANITGRVEVWVDIDEKGNVTKARAVDGPTPLREVSVAAALQSKFKPLVMEEKPYATIGSITYFLPESKEQEFKDHFEMLLFGVRINSGFLGIPFMNESWTSEVNRIDPSIMKEVEAEVKRSAPDRVFDDLVKGTNVRLEKRLTGEKLWYFQFGARVGGLFYETLKGGLFYEPSTDPRNVKPPRSDAVFRARLTAIKELARTVPPDFPSSSARKLKSLLDLLDRDELVSDEAFKLVKGRMFDILENARMQIPSED